MNSHGPKFVMTLPTFLGLDPLSHNELTRNCGFSPGVECLMPKTDVTVVYYDITNR